MDLEALKEQAAVAALAEIRSGQQIGLGTGSTVFYVLKHLGEALKSGRLSGVSGVPTSERTDQLCHEFGIPLLALEQCASLDLAIDGADEIDPALDLIKGLGGALLREKMVAVAARRFIVVADATKRVGRLGEKAPVPVEVVPFAWRWHLSWLASLGLEPKLRTGKDGEPLRTDNGNLILDAGAKGGLADPHALQAALQSRPGVAGHGLFLGMTAAAYLAMPGGVEILRRA